MTRCIYFHIGRDQNTASDFYNIGIKERAVFIYQAVIAYMDITPIINMYGLVYSYVFAAKAE